MANICTINLKIYGKDENCKAFLSALEQKETVYIGRGAWTENDVSIYEVPNDMRVYDYLGETKWSIASSLFHSAQEMRENPTSWYFGNNVDASALTFLTLSEACKTFEVCCEAWSSEPAMNFSEHLYITNVGNIQFTEDLNTAVDTDQFFFKYIWDDCGLLK